MDRTQELSGIVAQALDQAADAVAIFTADDDLVGSEIVFVNDAFARMTGYDPGDLVGHSALLLMGLRPALDDVRASLGARRSGPYFAVTRRTRSDGTVYDVEVRIAPIVDRTGSTTHYALSHREIRSGTSDTEAWPASSSSLGLAVAGLRAAGNAVDDVVSELREAIVELALLDDPRCDDLTEKLGDALEAAAEAHDVVGELSSLSRVDIAPTVLDVHEPLELAVRITRGIVGARARLVRRYEALPAVHANAAALARTFAQLIQNAAAAIPPFLPVANCISISTYQDAGGDIVVEIADTGVGIPPQAVGRVFDPFFTTRGSHASDGLGLTIARADILTAGGSIGVESVEGRGSRFTVRLPAVPGTCATGTALASSELPTRRVLVACDDQQTARRLRAFFEDERTIVVDTDVDEAVERLGRSEPYDLIVADASDRSRTNLRERLADRAPEALMNMFEITTTTLPAKSARSFEHPSGVRLALVPDVATQGR
jgi:PAS domain S-box-containing protein